MTKETYPAAEAQDEFITLCGGIQPEPLLPPPEEDIPFHDPTLAGNDQIEEVIHLFCQDQTPELFTAVCLAIRAQMAKDGHFIFPADITESEEGDTLFSFKTLEANGITALVAFTRQEELRKGPKTAAVSQFIDTMLEALLQMEEIHGLLLNPWGESLFLGKEDIGMILTPGSERFI